MNDATDKPYAGPAANPDAAPTGDAAQSPGQASSPQGASEAQLAQFNETLSKMQRTIEGQRSMYDRRFNELQNRIAPQAPPQHVAAGQAPEEQQLVQQINNEFQARDMTTEQMAYEQAKTSFKVDNPNWQEDWSEMERILNDDSEVQNVAVYGPNGKVDYGKTLRYTHSLVRDTRLSAAQQRAVSESARLEQQRASQNEQAVISGQGGYALPEGIEPQDIGKMTPKEMIDKGVYPIDPNDPPVFDD
jgi:hypothetical protein